LIRSLAITNQIERQVTIEALEKFGPEASPAFPALLTCLSNSDRYASAQLKRVLKNIDPKRAIELGL
jgi:HEAT repeat protein